MNSEPLWSDDEINWQVDLSAASSEDAYRTKRMVRKVRDELQARITELEAQLSNQYQRIERFVELVDQLEAQLAERWEPLPDDFTFTPTTERLPGYPTEFRITNQGRTLIFAEYDTEYELDLHDKAICRRVTQEPTHE